MYFGIHCFLVEVILYLDIRNVLQSSLGGEAYMINAFYVEYHDKTCFQITNSVYTIFSILMSVLLHIPLGTHGCLGVGTNNKSLGVWCSTIKF